MATYILRSIPEPLWACFKDRSKQDGIPMRALILLLIEAYTAGKISVNARKAKE